MKDVTTTSFGLVIAYVLPGLVGLYALTFWSSNLKVIAHTFYTAESDLGLSLMVLAAAVVIGLLVNGIRYICYERVLCRVKKLESDKFQKLVQQANLSAFTTILEENFRYHQFFGSMSLLLPLLQAGLLKYINNDVADFMFIFITILFTVALSFLMFIRHEVAGGTAGLKDLLRCYSSAWSLLSKIGRTKFRTGIWVSTVVVAIIYILWLTFYQGISNRILVGSLVLGFVALEVTTGAVAIVSFRRYVERVNQILQ